MPLLGSFAGFFIERIVSDWVLELSPLLDRVALGVGL